MLSARRSLMMLAVVIGLAAASLVAIALKPAVLGLDLQGGVEVILEGRPTAEAAVDNESLNRSVEVIRNRVDTFGVAEPEIQTQGTNQIVVALPGAQDANRVVQDLIRPAQLAFYDLEESRIGNEGSENLFQTVRRAQGIIPAHPERGAETLWAFKRADRSLVAGPVFVEQGQGKRAEARQELMKLVEEEGVRPNQVTVEAVPKGLTIVREETPLLQSRPDGPTTTNYYIFQDNPGLTGNDISRASSMRDVSQGGSGEPIVTMDFTSAGGDKFADITRQISSRGARLGTFQHFAVVLDGEMISSPYIDYNELRFGIDGGAARIQGNFTPKSAQLLADQLNSGAIPIRLVPVSTKQVDATVGAQALRQALVAGILGLALVVTFMVLYYRVLGMVAALGLLIYAALFYAAVVLVPITLTLPGLAGVILTIGVAADANIVIFERVREEGRRGKSVIASLSAGYRRGISAIIDANIVTLATAAIVFLFATGGPRGFAFTLAIGVLMSLFTAIVATRAVFGVMAESRFLRDDRYMGLKRGRVFTFDWMARWKWWVAVSVVPLVFGFTWMAFSGLNLGLDFESGTRITTAYSQPVTEAQVRDAMTKAGVPGARVQGTTQTIDGEQVRGYQIRTESLNPEQQTRAVQALQEDAGLRILTREDVGPTFGRQIIRNAIQAVIISFIIVALYLVIRFEYKLAIPAMISVIQDVALSICVYAVIGLEISSATVAALLTIMGYSLYDVVIVFDRIRENVPYMRGSRYRDIVNRSINETLTRSLITSFTTLTPVLGLLIFGGPGLRDFAVALFVGIATGGISSIIIAAPLASWWKERSPDEKRLQVRERRRARLAATDADVVDAAVLERAEQALRASHAAEARGVLTAGSSIDDEGEDVVDEPLPDEPDEAPSNDEEDQDRPRRRTPRGSDGKPRERRHRRIQDRKRRI